MHIDHTAFSYTDTNFNEIYANTFSLFFLFQLNVLKMCCTHSQCLQVCQCCWFHESTCAPWENLFPALCTFLSKRWILHFIIVATFVCEHNTYIWLLLCIVIQVEVSCLPLNLLCSRWQLCKPHHSVSAEWRLLHQFESSSHKAML